MVVLAVPVAQRKAVKQSSSLAGMQLEVSLERLSVVSYDDWRSELRLFRSGFSWATTAARSLAAGLEASVANRHERMTTQHTLDFVELVPVVSAEVPTSNEAQIKTNI